MRAMRPLAVLGGVALLTMAACTQGQGPTVERTREVAGFTRIDAGAGIHVKVTIGPAGPLAVRAQENIQDKVTTTVRNGTLRVEANDDFTVADPVVIEVATPNLSAIAVSGGATVELSGLDADAIEVSLSGGGRTTITGTVRQVTLTARGGAIASLANLVAHTASVDLDGGATVEMQATGSVQGSATGGARLTVSGGGSLQVDTSGGAEVIRG